MNVSLKKDVRSKHQNVKAKRRLEFGDTVPFKNLTYAMTSLKIKFQI